LSINAFAQQTQPPSFDSIIKPPSNPPIHKHEPDTINGAPVFVFPKVLPRPKIDFQEFFRSEVKYPKLAIKEGIQGTVFVKCVVLANGNIDTSSVQIGKGLKNGGAGLNAEALRVVKLLPEGSFEPGYNNNGEGVNVWISIPIRFMLGNPKKEKKEKSKKRKNRDEE
jgi:TonB family protein